MSRFLETIKIQDGKIFHLNYHQARVNHTAAAFRFPGFCLKKLSTCLSLPPAGLWKWRVLYDESGFTFQEMLPYVPKIISGFFLAEAVGLDYSFKFADRSCFSPYLCEDGDEPVFVKNGRVTDASYANLIFRQGEEWVTPVNPLLQGTQRQALLDEGKIVERDIPITELKGFQGFKLINAMMGLDAREYPLAAIRNLQL